MNKSIDLNSFSLESKHPPLKTFMREILLSLSILLNPHSYKDRVTELRALFGRDEEEMLS
jgi:hypothetical protein